MVGGSFTRGSNHGPFGIDITGRVGGGGLRDRTDRVIVAAATGTALSAGRSVIQGARTGMTSSERAAGMGRARAYRFLAVDFLPEALALAPVRRHFRDLAVVVDHVVLAEALGEFAGLGVAQPDPVADP